VKWSADFKNILNTTVIDGSEMSAYLLHLINTTSKYAARSDSVKRRFSPAKNREMEAAQKVISDEYKTFLRKEIRANPSSPALISFVDNLDTFEDSEYYKLLDDGTYRAFKGDPLVEDFHNKVTRYVRTGVGTFAPEIDLPSFKGGNVKLSSLKNKVVLVDFWAVHAQNTAGYAPHLVRIYKRFANKGFEIYAVSLFGNVENLSAGSAVKAYTEVGIHVKAPQGWETEILGTYGVNSIRSTVLIDRDGRILARDISYEELEKWLEKLLP
jgi:thiol-disulfide isomerase/thioredoxin